MNQGYDSTTVSFEKINENSEKLKNGTKQLWLKFSITNEKMPMVKSLQFYHRSTISQMSGLSLSILVIILLLEPWKYWDWENFESNLQEFRKWKDPEYVELETNETALEDDMQVK